MPFKTAMYYEKGKLVNTQMPEVLFVELLELKDNPENIMIDFDIEPKEATPQVEQAIDLFYKNQQKPDRPNSDQQQ